MTSEATKKSKSRWDLGIDFSSRCSIIASPYHYLDSPCRNQLKRLFTDARPLPNLNLLCLLFSFITNHELRRQLDGKLLSGDLEGLGASTYELQRNLVQATLSSDSSGGVSSSFSLITPSSAVFQVIIGGGGGGGFVGGSASAGGGASGGASSAAAEAPAAGEKKVEKEESDDEEMGFDSLFD